MDWQRAKAEGSSLTQTNPPAGITQRAKPRTETMSTTETKALATIIRTAWKGLALADQDDAETLLELITTTLESLEALERAGE